MHEMQTVVTDVRGVSPSVCLSICLSRGVIRCSLCQITLALCYEILSDLPFLSDRYRSLGKCDLVLSLKC